MAGRGRGCGRGRGHAGAARPARSSSSAMLSSEGEWEFEFIIVLNSDPIGIQRLPDKFAEFIAGNELAALHLREAGCGFCRWSMDVLFGGRGNMYLHTSWEKFTRFHDLHAGRVLTFSYQGDEQMSVKVFDDTSCRRHYHDDDEEEEDD
nr:B3 domain-containing protein Os03g0212300-like [Lolium perenne]